MSTFILNGVTYTYLIPRDGWIPVADSWTYASATTINVPSDATLTYKKGWGIRFKQGGAYKYMYITTVAATLLTVTGGSDYSVANAAITDVAVCPDTHSAFGFPARFNFTSTVTGSGGSIGTYAETQAYSRFVIVGGMIQVYVKKTMTNLGSWTGGFRIAGPVVAADTIVTPASVVTPNASITPRAFGYSLSGQSYMMFVKTLGVADLDWADLAANDVVIVNIFYPF